MEALSAFDSHERGILLQWAAGGSFAVSDDLRATLGAGLGVKVPRQPYVAMDYTLDWLHAALTCFQDASAWVSPQRNGPSLVEGSQEDVDLLIAWEDTAPRLILLEAKGFTGWSNKQMTSKAKRLDAILPEPVRAAVDVHLVLAGPKPTVGLKTDFWPDWMHKEGRIHFLVMPSPGPRWSVRRGTEAGGNPNTWQAVPRTWT